jgi:ZIP family zinc transporter
MEPVILTALGVGSATVIGAIIGFLFKNISHKFSDIVLAFAAGIMLAAAVVGLIIPSLEFGGDLKLLYTIGGIFTGAICLTLVDKLVPHMHRLAGADIEDHKKSNLSRVILFVFAIGIHNLPEGIAAGVGFGSGNTTQALMIALGIALQNIPEGMILISPMLNAGISKGKAFMIALVTGLVEVVGTFIGYFAVSLATAILPFALAFAGGTMLYVVSDEMFIETHGHKSECAATYALILGFCVMIVMDVLLA